MLGASISVSTSTSTIQRGTFAAQPASGASQQLQSSRRRFTVWAIFTGAMTAVAGVLLIGDKGAPSMEAAMSAKVVGPSQLDGASLILPREADLVSGQWKSIVIHHSATPAGDSVTLNRQHTTAGLSGLGYHFVIGNGQGLGDGLVEVGYRWNRQLPGAHVAATGTGGTPGIGQVGLSKAGADQFNRSAIGICLIGNGNRREFTDRQINELVAVVRALQEKLAIPSSAVYLHSDLAKVASPGAFFPMAEFEAQIRR